VCALFSASSPERIWCPPVMNLMAIKQHKGLKDNPLYNYEFEEKLE
jgi:hypothetical protein